MYGIIAYGWLEFVWQYEWFIIHRDTLCGLGLYLQCEPLFMIWTIVCVALSKDVHLFTLSRGEGDDLCKQWHV